MKNISLVLNVILIAAVAFLFYKVYSAKPASPVAVAGGKTTMVFVNADTLFEKYTLFKELREKFDGHKDSIDAMLKMQAAMLDKEVAKYQENAPNLSPNDRQRTEDALMGKQQSIVQMKDQLYEQLREQQDAMDDSIHHNLVGYLKEYNKTRNYAFILGFQKGSGILLANDSLDITTEVLEGINKVK